MSQAIGTVAPMWTRLFGAPPGLPAPPAENVGRRLTVRLGAGAAARAIAEQAIHELF